MEDSRKLSNDPIFIIIICVISILLFIFASTSIFATNILGILQAAGSGLGIGLISTLSQKRRPSRIWVANIVGSLIGLVICVIIIREKTQQPHFVWNQLVLYILPISAICGSLVSFIPIIRKIIDQL